MINTFLKKLPKTAREWGAWLGTALMVFGGLRIYGLAGTVDMQDAANLPGMPLSVLLGQIALNICIIFAGYAVRKYALRAAKAQKSAFRAAALLGAALPR